MNLQCWMFWIQLKRTCGQSKKIESYITSYIWVPRFSQGFYYLVDYRYISLNCQMGGNSMGSYEGVTMRLRGKESNLWDQGSVTVAAARDQGRYNSIWFPPSHLMNITPPTEFFLFSLSDAPSFRLPLFLCFLLIYLITFTGNIMMLSVIVLTPRLHSPMYQLLSSFSLMDFSFSSTTVPSMLATMVCQKTIISFPSCIIQIFFFHTFGNSENLLLSVMAYDRYVAICHPLRYSAIMNRNTCVALCSVCCACASLHALLHAMVTSRLDFHHHHVHIPHFFCDIPPLLEISSSDTTFNQLLIFTEGSLVALVPSSLTVLSYIRITISILRIHSSTGRQKAFSTCASHLMVFFLFSASAVSMYFRPSSVSSPHKGKFVTLMYTTLTPMFNPYIYCLRNSEVKTAVRKWLPSKNLKQVKI
ncbi:olfactory receptor 1L4-like [Dendropsophus ebraccatus]|uniref:olfactory receptor 1L4-like n=1 Tax=Dendropsophus ebraccatus TaxID=150705 RepID=UPI0038317878